MSFRKTLEEIETRSEELKNSVFTGVEMLSIFWETSPEIIERILPAPLQPAKRPVVIAFIANYPKTNQGLPYSESALFLRVDYNGEGGNYYLAMHVTDDRAMIGGREIWGFPKKMANIHLERNGSEVDAWSERAGTRTIEAHVNITGKFNDPETPKIISDMGLLPTKRKPTVNFNFKYFPTPERTGFDYAPRLVRQETAINPQSMEMGEAELTLASSPHDPWAELEVVKVLGSLYIKSNNIMFPGSVVAEVDGQEFLPYSYIKWDWY
ncbi:MAG TPA: acetoacetate decarboxylase family protein [Candidatus Lokiarchaeia archaeon]|nr:acetoacetate decarboxylase family protein [Candidatus Lokiarchaeia archaeon]